MTDKQVDEIIERLVKRIEDANTYFLSSIGSSINKLKDLSPEKAHQLVQILKYGGNYEEIIRKLSKYTGLNIKEIEGIFTRYAKTDQLFYKKFYEYKNKPFVPFERNEELKRYTKSLSNVVKREMYNYTRKNVLGYTVKDLNGKIKFYGLREVYNKVLDEALLNVGQGKETFDSAMRRTLKELGTSGIKTLEYESGHAIRLDSAVRMHLKGRLTEMHNENQKVFGEEFDADGVEISVHEYPAPDHEDVQGRQFSKKEYEKLQLGDIAKDYTGVKRTLDHDGKNGYRPIGEMNCYHKIFSIVLGVSKPEYSEEQLKQIKEDNEKGFEWKGKKYSKYKGTQMQRRIETEIRNQKNIYIMARETGDEDLMLSSRQKINALRSNYMNLSAKSKLPIKVKRMQVAGY